MSTIEITSKIEALKELEALIEEAKAEAEALRDEIKTEMLNRNTEEMEAGQYIGFCVALFVAPREKTFQCACVTVDRTVGQPFLSHLKNHVVEDCRIEAIDGEGHIQSFRNCVKMLFVSCYGFVFNSSRCDC